MSKKSHCLPKIAFQCLILRTGLLVTTYTISNNAWFLQTSSGQLPYVYVSSKLHILRILRIGVVSVFIKRKVVDSLENVVLEVDL